MEACYICIQFRASAHSSVNIKLSSGAIRIALRFMLMSRCRAMHPVRNTAFGEQALHGCISSFLRTAP